MDDSLFMSVSDPWIGECLVPQIQCADFTKKLYREMMKNIFYICRDLQVCHNLRPQSNQPKDIGTHLPQTSIGLINEEDENMQNRLTQQNYRCLNGGRRHFESSNRGKKKRKILGYLKQWWKNGSHLQAERNKQFMIFPSKQT